MALPLDATGTPASLRPSGVLIVRAWPGKQLHQLEGRARVDHDGFPRVEVCDYDYRELAGVGDDVLLLDWDTAVHREDLHAFAAHARQDPDRPLVGPCRIYHDGPNGLAEPVWNAKRFNPGMITMRWVQRGETAHLFGFGMTYLPAPLIHQFIAANPGRILDDTSFSGWYHAATRAETRIDWSVSPVHLHYDVPQGGRV